MLVFTQEYLDLQIYPKDFLLFFYNYAGSPRFTQCSIDRPSSGCSYNLLKHLTFHSQLRGNYTALIVIKSLLFLRARVLSSDFTECNEGRTSRWMLMQMQLLIRVS
ncbi:hypothetical protein XELAEV_18021514mg [Xenopus laevis]|uniref:Uncharacterized protein n=1 Tax=Xenopus laevis TaxID=8355 RepID=A0A974HRN6_XENLA|nr:hypothetical protein XELAEV_18021514mg [Xenopus laevis]